MQMRLKTYTWHVCTTRPQVTYAVSCRHVVMVAWSCDSRLLRVWRLKTNEIACNLNSFEQLTISFVVTIHLYTFGYCGMNVEYMRNPMYIIFVTMSVDYMAISFVYNNLGRVQPSIQLSQWSNT